MQLSLYVIENEAAIAAVPGAIRTTLAVWLSARGHGVLSPAYLQLSYSLCITTSESPHAACRMTPCHSFPVQRWGNRIERQSTGASGVMARRRSPVSPWKSAACRPGMRARPKPRRGREVSRSHHASESMLCTGPAGPLWSPRRGLACTHYPSCAVACFCRQR